MEIDDDEELKSSLNEEISIMDERAQGGTYFSADTFQEPIKNLHAREAMTLEVTATVGEAVELLKQIRHGALPITKERKLVGIVTERDLMRKVIGVLKDWEDRPISDIMTPNPDSLHMDDPMVFIMNRMHVGRYRHVPIVNDAGEPTHIVSIRDVLRFILEHFEAEVSNIPPEPYRGPPSEYGG